MRDMSFLGKNCSNVLRPQERSRRQTGNKPFTPQHRPIVATVSTRTARIGVISLLFLPPGHPVIPPVPDMVASSGGSGPLNMITDCLNRGLRTEVPAPRSLCELRTHPSIRGTCPEIVPPRPGVGREPTTLYPRLQIACLGCPESGLCAVPLWGPAVPPRCDDHGIWSWMASLRRVSSLPTEKGLFYPISHLSFHRSTPFRQSTAGPLSAVEAAKPTSRIEAASKNPRPDGRVAGPTLP
jgi:hypothetical protein